MALGVAGGQLARDDAPVASEMTVGWALIEAIQAHGVNTAFGIPGTHNLELFRALDRLGMRVVTMRHEQGAGYGADGWSQLSGHPGLVVTTSGPGLLNVAAAAASAYCESRALLIVSSGAARGTVPGSGDLHAVKDSVGALDALVGWSRRAETGAAAVKLIHRAFAEFERRRPRPIHIEVPADLLEERFIPEEHRELSVPPPLAVDRGVIKAAAVRLAGAEHPVILAGGGSLSGAAELRDLAERLGAPVITTVNGKGVIPEDHPLAVGSQLRFAAVRDLCNQADALLILGSKLGEAELWGGEITPAGAVIRVDIDPDQLGIGPPATCAILGDCRAVVTELLAALADHVPQPWPSLERLRASVDQQVEAVDPVSAGLSRAVFAALPPDAIIAGDSSQVTYLGTVSTLMSLCPHQLLCTPTFATLGYGLPAGLGAAIAAPDRVVVCLIGDGALMFALQELATVVAEGVRLIVICVDNGGYREIRQNMLEKGMRPVGVDLPQPDWVALGHAFGMAAESVAAADITAAVRAATKHTGATLLHVSV